jgi:hypothetical protein
MATRKDWQVSDAGDFTLYKCMLVPFTDSTYPGGAISCPIGFVRYWTMATKACKKAIINMAANIFSPTFWMPRNDMDPTSPEWIFVVVLIDKEAEEDTIASIPCTSMVLLNNEVETGRELDGKSLAKRVTTGKPMYSLENGAFGFASFEKEED